MLDSLVGQLDFSALTAQITAWLPRLGTAITLLLAFAVLVATANRSLRSGLSRVGVPSGTRDLLVRLVRYAICVVGTVTVLDQLGVNVASLVAGLGLVGLAVSFAAQDTVANLISGVTIILDRPFVVGDTIALDGGLYALVSQIRLRTTVLTTFDNETLVVPNKTLAQERIINYTLTPRSRVRVEVGIAYKESIEAARAVLLGLLPGDERVLRDPAPEVIVAELGASSVDLELRFWTEDPRHRLPLFWEYTEKSKTALDAAGIQIPYPHMQLVVEQSEALRQLARIDPVG